MTAVQWLYDQISNMFPLEYANELEGHFAKAEIMDLENSLKNFTEGYSLGRWHLNANAITPKGNKLYELFKQWELEQKQISDNDTEQIKQKI